MVNIGKVNKSKVNADPQKIHHLFICLLELFQINEKNFPIFFLFTIQHFLHLVEKEAVNSLFSDSKLSADKNQLKLKNILMNSIVIDSNYYIDYLFKLNYSFDFYTYFSTNENLCWQ